MNLKILIRKDNVSEPLIKIMKEFNSAASIINVDDRFDVWVERCYWPPKCRKFEHYERFEIEDEEFYECFNKTIKNFDAKELKIHLTKHLLDIKQELLL